MNIDYYNSVAKVVHETAKSKGWHDLEKDDAAFNTRAVVLITCEVAELVESYRSNTLNHPCDKHNLPLTQIEEEVADIAIRILDHMARMGKKLAPSDEHITFPPNATFMDWMLAFQMRAIFLHDCHANDHLDFLIMLERFCIVSNINLERAIELKNAYNTTRPYLHGNKRA